jgi:hypothetical protein
MLQKQKRVILLSRLVLILGLIISCEEPDTTRPEVSITFPTQQGTVSEIVTVTCVATDNIEVARVELWVDGVSTDSTDENSPYSFIWNTLKYADGSSHILTVRAYDSEGNVADSDPVTVTVDNSDSYPTASVMELSISPDSYLISWSQNYDDDFERYELFESSNQDMSNATLRYSSTTASENSYTITEMAIDEYLYYQVTTTDQGGLQSNSNIVEYYVEEHIHSFVGHWDLSNFAHQTTYLFTDSSIAPSYFPGDTAGTSTLTWAEYSSMGVSASITMMEDGTFSLSGNFPIANDTLGVAPLIVPLIDAGTWSEGESDGLPTLLIDGAFYDIGGLLTINDDDSVFTLADSSSNVVTMIVPAGSNYISAPLRVETSWTVGFTRQ